MAWLLITLVTLSVLPLVHLQTECPLITASELPGLMSEALSSTQQGQTVTVQQLLEHNVVCLAQGTVKNQYRMVSVIASYLLSGSSTLTENQFHFQCVSGSWSTNVLNDVGLSLSQSPLSGNLTTPLRRDCRLCIDIPGSSNDEHCVGKRGMMQTLTILRRERRFFHLYSSSTIMRSHDFCGSLL